MFLRQNTGTREKPKYDGESIRVNASESPLKETGHAAPVVADWDGDGKWDLVIGSADGSVGWYRNIGTESNPKFGRRNMLVKPAAESKSFEQNLKANEKPIPGVRAQICVTDFNGDGLLDLIVGDYSSINWTRELTIKERAQFQELEASENKLAAASEDVRAAMFAADTDEVMKFQKEKEYREIVDEYVKVRKKRKEFYADSRSASFVWLYLRTSRQEANSPLASGNIADDTPQDDDLASNSSPVAVDIAIEPTDSNRTQLLSVTFDVAPRWHLYARAPENAGYQATEIQLKLPDGVKAAGEWQKPQGEILPRNPEAEIYTGLVVFNRELHVASGDSSNIEIVVVYQVCNEELCLPPKTISKSLKILSR